MTPFTLTAFVKLVSTTSDLSQQAHQVDTLRSDRDTLLQYVLDVNLKLQEYDQERNNFFARVLHDFRTPLTALHGYCGLLAGGKLGPINPVQKELLERMQYSTLRLMKLAAGAGGLLAQGRFERAPKCNASDIGESLEQALHDVYPFIQERRIEVDVDVQPAAGLLRFEAEQIQQVFVNLLENSCKFIPREGRIEIRGYSAYQTNGTGSENSTGCEHRAPNGYRVDINDSGPGVPAALAEKVFEQYASYMGADDRSGGGLGLAICKLIINAHRGAIWATPSQSGGRFSFFLPFKTAKSANSDGCADAPMEIEQAC